MKRAWPRVELHDSLEAQCVSEINATFPLESGGVLMGRRLSQTRLQVQAIIGPGPEAEHGRHRFRPDLAWQHEQIRVMYERSAGETTYLGDWHSHPHAAHGRLSKIDERALRDIMAAPEAQCAEPLMAIFWGGPGTWTLSFWQARAGSFFSWTRLRLVELERRVLANPY